MNDNDEQYQSAFDDGYSEGREDGYAEGWDDGYADGESLGLDKADSQLYALKKELEQMTKLAWINAMTARMYYLEARGERCCSDEAEDWEYNLLRTLLAGGYRDPQL